MIEIEFLMTVAKVYFHFLLIISEPQLSFTCDLWLWFGLINFIFHQNLNTLVEIYPRYPQLPNETHFLGLSNTIQTVETFLVLRDNRWIFPRKTQYSFLTPHKFSLLYVYVIKSTLTIYITVPLLRFARTSIWEY